jgi:hypothetical protein
VGKDCNGKRETAPENSTINLFNKTITK